MRKVLRGVKQVLVGGVVVGSLLLIFKFFATELLAALLGTWLLIMLWLIGGVLIGVEEEEG